MMKMLLLFSQRLRVYMIALFKHMKCKNTRRQKGVFKLKDNAVARTCGHKLVMNKDTVLKCVNALHPRKK